MDNRRIKGFEEGTLRYAKTISETTTEPRDFERDPGRPQPRSFELVLSLGSCVVEATAGGCGMNRMRQLA